MRRRTAYRPRRAGMDTVGIMVQRQHRPRGRGEKVEGRGMTQEQLTPDDIDELARRAKDGDRDALERLLAAVRPRCLNVCRQVLPYTPDAEDACQEALINIANKIGSWGQQGRFTTWMHVVAVNSARTTYRRMKNQAISSAVLPLEKP